MTARPGAVATAHLLRVRTGVVLVFALIAAFLGLAAVGAWQAGRDQRVLSVLDPLVAWIRTSGKASSEWLFISRRSVGWATTGTASFIAVWALIVGRLRALPVVLLAAAVSSVTWGEILLLSDRVSWGVGLYICGIASAVGMGVWCPMRRLTGFPEPFQPTSRDQRQWPQSPAANRAVAPTSGADVPSPAASVGRSLPWGGECLVIFILTLVGLVARLYALTELPNHVDLEMVESMVASRTLHGFLWWIQDALMSNSGGLIHLLPKGILFALFGSSIYSLRLSAVLFGTAAIPLMYWLVRRIAGCAPAIAAAMLFLTAPEQLFWSRTENTHFAPVPLIALMTAHLSLWMIQRFSMASLLATALWIPICRFSYAAATLMVLYPLALFGHAVLFVRGAWRTIWYALPVLAAGVTLWFFSLSILLSCLNNFHWQYVDPLTVHGAALWRNQGEFVDASRRELMILQGRLMTNNLGHVLKGLTYHVRGFSHWNDRIDVAPGYMTMINPGVAVIAALAMGYLLGQFQDRRAFALLIWVVLGLLPGLMSDEPADRRIATVYPALYTMAGVLVGAVVRLVRGIAGPWLARVTTTALGVCVAILVWTDLASHLLLPTSPTSIDSAIRFVTPVFEKSDGIFHNLDPRLAMGLVLGNLDRFLKPGATPCFQSVTSKTWLSVILDPRCDFKDRAYLATMSQKHVEELRAGYNPKRLTFLLQDTSYNRARIDSLRELYPMAEVRSQEGTEGSLRLIALTVGISDVEALHSPSVRIDSPQTDVTTLEDQLLAGVKLTPQPAGSAAPSPEISVHGGLVPEREGWYRFGIAPPCPVATFAIDQRPVSPELQPMLIGAHTFDITLPSSTACRLPLQILIQSHDERDMTPLPAGSIVSPPVTSLPHVKARPVIPYAGYSDAKIFVRFRERPLDFGADAQGKVNVLLRHHGVLQVRRFDRDGHEEATWQPRVPEEDDLSSIAVDAAGTIVLMGNVTVLFFDPHGVPLGGWKNPWTWVNEISFWRDGQILKAMRGRNSIALLSRDGELRRELRDFEGGPGRFLQPVSVTTSPDGYMLVVQQDGQALLFSNAGEQWNPKFIRSFSVDFSTLPPGERRYAFDGPDRILFRNVAGTWALVYDLTGERMMASNPARDLSALGFGDVIRIESLPDRLYVLDQSARIWSIAR